VQFRNEIEYFWNQKSWAVQAIPDPKDPDPVRYAILAVLTDQMVRAFNHLIERGLPRDAASDPHADFVELATRERVPEKRERIEAQGDFAKC
jgi:hypothetical protein